MRIEKPAHRVTLQVFALGKTEVTQGQWRAMMGNNPSNFTSCGDNCPVEKVSWDDAQTYHPETQRQNWQTLPLAERSRMGIRLPCRQPERILRQ